MNKQEWLQMKQTQQMPMELFYEFYIMKNNKDSKMNKEEFRNHFQNYVYYLGFIPTKKIIEYFDNLFIVTKLTNNKGQIIKEY